MSLVTFTKLGKHGLFANQIFQIATVVGVAIKNNCEYKLPKWKYSQYFENELPLLEDDIQIDAVIDEGNDINYRDIVIDNDKSIDLYGFFQSYKYFEHCEDLIKKYFVFKKELLDRCNICKLDKENLPYVKHYDIAIKQKKYCSLHIRRGDYLKYARYGYYVLDINYFNKAIETIEKDNTNEDIKYIVFSDDISWCEENFKGDKFIFSNGTEIQDLCRMTMCDYAIIANSTFSWWGAFLGKEKKKIVAPNSYHLDNKKYISIKGNKE